MFTADVGVDAIIRFGKITFVQNAFTLNFSRDRKALLGVTTGIRTLDERTTTSSVTATL